MWKLGNGGGAAGAAHRPRSLCLGLLPGWLRGHL